MSLAAVAVSAMAPGRFAYDGPIDPTVRSHGGPMRKKLLQHTLLAAVAAWALHMAQGPSAADRPFAAGPMAAQALAMR